MAPKQNPVQSILTPEVLARLPPEVRQQWESLLKPDTIQALAKLSAPDHQKEVQVQAQALVEKQKHEGTWSGGILAHTEYQRRPLEWIVKFLGIPENTLRWSLNGYDDHQWDGDVDPLVKALEGLAAWEDVGIESATGTGKSVLAALIVFWFLATHEDSIVVTAAPKEDQLLLHIWKWIGHYMPRFQKHFPQAKLLPGSGKLRMRGGDDTTDKETWAATAFVCGIGANEESATKAQGFHAPHMLIITEETPGIHPALMNAFQNTRTDDHNLHLALGNPDHKQDPLHTFCFDEKEQPNPGVRHVRISALDHPNIVTGRPVVPGAIGRRRLDQRTKRYGEGSRLYQSRVRGISPAESQEALIKWEWCVAAGKRWADPEFRKGAPARGVDVAASENGDKGAIARGQGACLTEVVDFPCPDPNELGRRVFEEAMREGIDPKHVGVDIVGVGHGTVNELKRLGMRVRAISGAQRAIPQVDTELRWSERKINDAGREVAAGPLVVDSGQFDNQRSQGWWMMREDLRLGRIALPEDVELWRDLTTPEYGTANGKIWVEGKEDIHKRLRRSPNKGDAAVYWNMVRRRTPIRTENQIPATENARGVDRGLERLLAAREKKRLADERRFRRALGLGRRRA